MKASIATIETYLLRHEGWVSAEALCEKFDLDERLLRAVGLRPGLCSGFAISGQKGYRHALCATPGEWEAFAARLTAHADGEKSHVATLRALRDQAAFDKELA